MSKSTTWLQSRGLSPQFGLSRRVLVHNLISGCKSKSTARSLVSRSRFWSPVFGLSVPFKSPLITLIRLLRHKTKVFPSSNHYWTVQLSRKGRLVITEPINFQKILPQIGQVLGQHRIKFMSFQQHKERKWNTLYVPRESPAIKPWSAIWWPRLGNALIHTYWP